MTHRTSSPERTPQVADRAAFLDALLDAVDQPVMAADLAGRIIYWSRGAESFYGWTADDMLGQDGIVRLLEEPDVARGRAIREGIHAGGAWRGELTVRARDGRRIPVLVTASPLRDDTGTVRGVVAVHRDITDLRHAEAAAETAQDYRRLLERTFQSLDEAVFVVDADRAIQACNPAAERLFGYPRPELLGRSTERLHVSAETYVQFGRVCQRAVEAYGVFRGESRMCRSDRTVIETEHTIAPIDPEAGWAGGVVSVVRDISARKAAEPALEESEAWFHAVFDRAGFGIVVAGADRAIVDANQAFHRMFGDGAALIGRDYRELAHPQDRHVGARQMAELLAGARDRFEVEKRYVRQDGSVFWGRLTATVVRNGSGEPRYVVGMVEDITARREAEAALETSRRELRALSRRLLHAQEAERARLARNLHDDVGQVLTAVRLSLEAAVDDREGGAAREALRASVASVEEAVHQVRQMAYDLRPALLDELGLSAAVASYARRQAERAELALELDVEEVEDGLADTVQVACFRIMQEAVTNVVRHADAALLAIRLARADGMLELVVRDDGRGAAHGGNGPGGAPEGRLGILGMEERARLVGGSLQIESSPGAGTLVRCRVPIAGIHDRDAED